ncbi:hypothetical protein QBC44DRAFT_115424 [Cladorrhinum sp. PSN332]|nr:hypothetical protein QBC44DRAFT_115424 [Cladorrhinum sp. PSN332]
MTDQSQDVTSPSSHLRPLRATNNGYEQPDAVESSFLSTLPPGSTLAASSDGNDSLLKPSSSLRIPNRTHLEKRRSLNAHRSHKHRSSGAFLLADPLSSSHANPRGRDAHHPERRHSHRKSLDPYKSRITQDEQERSYPRAYSSGSQVPGLGVGYTLRAGDHGESATAPSAMTSRERDSLAGDTAVGSSPRSSIVQLDMESAQIVNMALNLSESRRLASRRNITQPAPPKLAPLPDSATGGSLRQHLQQQRRMSRTISPKPDRSPRVTAGRVFSPFQPAFEPDGSYRYHFSQSTLARAQKAKEYLELMAQYRRVLEFLPLLEVSQTTKASSASPPGTPNDSVQVFRISTNGPETAKVGRPYNPLQYIRNRKVRARERKAIDGAGQGFNEVIRVSEWVDVVAKWVATGQSRAPGNPVLPPFSGATSALQSSPPSNSSRSTVATTKPKRPRVDWVIDPADMIADIYWLELDDNKKLIEDRHWRRVFPQGSDSTRPLSRDDVPRMTTPGSNKDSSEGLAPSDKGQPEPPPSKHEHDHVLSSAKDRAQQKLRALKGSGHNRQSSTVTNRDFLRIHRGSLSESSDTDSDRQRRLRSVLEKQMEEMIAKEQKDLELQAPYDHAALRMKFASISPMTPERDLPYTSPEANNTRIHRRKDSRVELSEPEGKITGLKQRPAPAQSSARASLEVPSRGRRFSVDYESSQPNSPDMRPTRDGGLLPVIGMDLSPLSSRPGSPSRNPLTKVKSIFRERSKERSKERERERVPDAYASGEDVDSPAPLAHNRVASPETDWSAVSSPDRQLSRSPLGRMVTRGTDSTHRSHKSSGSVKLRPEDVSSGLRSLFRGPRIDTVLRSGVSKIGDLVWRKESGGADDQYSSTSSDESENEARGRSRGPRALRRGNGRDASVQNGKIILEATSRLPQFVSTTDYATSPDGKLTAHPPAQPLSRRSSRFDLLKPPRIDVHNASPSQSPPPLVERRRELGSDAESQNFADTENDGAQPAEFNTDTTLTYNEPRQFSSASSVRHWSIANCGSGAPIPTSAISKREIARLRALLLSSGIQAMEMDRRAKQSLPSSSCPKPPPTDILRLYPQPASQTTLYPLAARALAGSIETSATEFDAVSYQFAFEKAPALERRVEDLRLKLAGELTDLTHGATDQADEANHDLVSGQRLKVKRVVDVIEKMLRRRRRRFRWVRRAGWLGVEWALVGFMWWVWFLVMIARVFLCIGKGVVGVVRWLLWL